MGPEPVQDPIPGFASQLTLQTAFALAIKLGVDVSNLVASTREAFQA